MTETLLIETAARIGERLVTWQRRDGSWPCAEDDEGPRANLYSGSAGIALFLAEAAEATGSARFQVAARAGLRHAVSQTPMGSFAASLFLGRLGVAYALHRTGDAQEAERVLAPVLAERHRMRLDVISGSAGAIMGLLAMRAFPGALAQAVALGRDLMARADWAEECCSWDAKDAAGFAAGGPLAGFSHGASGIALALLRLYEVTGERDFLVTARGAFAYEETLRRGGRWLDLRFVTSAAEAEAKGHAPCAWCHGAAGIALAHWEAARIDAAQRDEHLERLALARAATRETLDVLHATPRADATLCHGITGLCEILSIIGEPPLAVAMELVRCEDWPSGMPDGRPDLSLMTGDAGIGHAMLRLALPQTVAPVLLIR